MQHRLIDQTQNLISAGTPLVGRLLGFATGFAIRKIMKLVFIGLGLLMLVLGFLEYKHWLSVNWTVAENQSSAIMTHVAKKIFNTLTIPTAKNNISARFFVPIRYSSSRFCLTNTRKWDSGKNNLSLPYLAVAPSSR